MTELEELFIANVSEIDRRVRTACRKYNMKPPDVEDFASYVYVHIIENDYNVLRKFEQRCSLSTYLKVVVQRLLNDYRIHFWGKWHPSAEAKRLGPVALRIEVLLHRDRKTPDDAYRLLEQMGEPISRAEFDAIAARLPERRPRPRLIDVDDVAGDLALPPDQIENDAAADERDRAATAVSGALGKALNTLEEEDLAILRLHFVEDLTVAEVARMLHLEQKPLYRRINGICRRLRESLIQEGIDAEEATGIIGRPETTLDVGLLAMGNASARPSSPMRTGDAEEEHMSP